MIPGFARLRPKATAEGSLWVLLAAMAARMGLSVLLTILLGRYLSAAEFGFFAIVSTVFAIAHEFTDMGSGNVAIRDTVGRAQNEARMLESLLGWRLGLSAVAGLACAGLAFFDGSRLHQLVLLAAVPVLMVSYFSAFTTVFQLRQAQLGPGLVNVLAQFATLVASGLLVGLKAAGALFAALVLLRELSILTITRALAVRILGYTPRPRLRHAEIRPFFGTAAIVALTTLFYHLQFQGGILFVRFLRPADEVGAFAAALRPTSPFLTLPWVLMLPLVPLLSWLARHRRDEFRRQARGAFYLCAGVGAVLAVASGQLAPSVMQFLYGGKFSQGPLAAVDVFRWLSLPLGCSFATAAMSTALLADNRERQLLFVSLLGLVLYVAANLVLLPRLGFAGSAVATALAVLVMLVGGLVLLGRGRDGYAPGARVLLFLIPAAVLFATLRLVSGPALLQLIVGGLLTGIGLIGVWCLPGVAQYRAEQARLSELARPRSPVAAVGGVDG